LQGEKFVEKSEVKIDADLSINLGIIYDEEG